MGGAPIEVPAPEDRVEVCDTVQIGQYTTINNVIIAGANLLYGYFHFGTYINSIVGSAGTNIVNIFYAPDDDYSPSSLAYTQAEIELGNNEQEPVAKLLNGIGWAVHQSGIDATDSKIRVIRDDGDATSYSSQHLSGALGWTGRVVDFFYDVDTALYYVVDLDLDNNILYFYSYDPAGPTLTQKTTFTVAANYYGWGGALKDGKYYFVYAENGANVDIWEWDLTATAPVKYDTIRATVGGDADASVDHWNKERVLVYLRGIWYSFESAAVWKKDETVEVGWHTVALGTGQMALIWGTDYNPEFFAWFTQPGNATVYHITEGGVFMKIQTLTEPGFILPGHDRHFKAVSGVTHSNFEFTTAHVGWANASFSFKHLAPATMTATIHADVPTTGVSYFMYDEADVFQGLFKLQDVPNRSDALDRAKFIELSEIDLKRAVSLEPVAQTIPTILTSVIDTFAKAFSINSFDAVAGNRSPRFSGKNIKQIFIWAEELSSLRVYWDANLQLNLDDGTTDSGVAVLDTDATITKLTHEIIPIKINRVVLTGAFVNGLELESIAFTEEAIQSDYGTYTRGFSELDVQSELDAMAVKIAANRNATFTKLIITTRGIGRVQIGHTLDVTYTDPNGKFGPFTAQAFYVINQTYDPDADKSVITAYDALFFEAPQQNNPFVQLNEKVDDTIQQAHNARKNTITNEETGFVNTTDSTLSVTAGIFKIIPSAATFVFYSRGVRFEKRDIINGETLDLTGEAENTLNYISYSVNGVLQKSTVQWNFINGTVPVATVYKDGDGTYWIAEERHPVIMDGATHEYLHETVGMVWHEGITFTVTATNDIDVTAGNCDDEDLEFSVAAGTPYADFVVIYRDVNLHWVDDAAAVTWAKIVGGDVQYDLNGVLSDAVQWVPYWFFVTNLVSRRIVVMVGQTTYASEALLNANASPANLAFGTLPAQEMKLVWMVPVKKDGTIGSGIQDFRAVSVLVQGTVSVTDHGALGGLNDDDHPQYLLVTSLAAQLLALNKISPSLIGVANGFVANGAGRGGALTVPFNDTSAIFDASFYINVTGTYTFRVIYYSAVNNAGKTAGGILNYGEWVDGESSGAYDATVNPFDLAVGLAQVIGFKDETGISLTADHHFGMRWTKDDNAGGAAGNLQILGLVLIQTA